MNNKFHLDFFINSPEIKKGLIMASIICNKKEVFIGWDKVVNVNHPKSLLLDSGFDKKGPYKRVVDKIITHHDVCTSAHMCHKILSRNNISTHFCIDNDGTIYQFLDCMHKAWHAVGVNSHSIGVDISTAYDVKYQEFYVNKYGKPKPVIESALIHGKEVGPFLGFYPEQIEAYKQLLIGLVKYYKIPLRYPKDEEGNYLLTNTPTAYKFKGVMCHFHSSRGKIDVPGFALDKIINELREMFIKNKEENQ